VFGICLRVVQYARYPVLEELADQHEAQLERKGQHEAYLLMIVQGLGSWNELR
jgi:hypothetical protein